jgi:hypothetical protein
VAFYFAIFISFLGVINVWTQDPENRGMAVSTLLVWVLITLLLACARESKK